MPEYRWEVVCAAASAVKCTYAHISYYSEMITVLREKTYRKLFAAQVVALLGTGLLTVALGLLAFDLAGGQAGAVLGTALTIKMLAYVFLAPLMTTLVARLPGKAVLVIADVVRAAMAACLPFVDQVWQIYVLIFLLQAASATFTPTFQALIPTVLPREKDYTHALSLSRLAYDLESLLSPLLAAILLTVVSYTHLFVGTLAGFLFSAILVATTVLPHASPPQTSGSILNRTLLGSRVLLKHPPLRGLLALNLVVACGTALVLVNTVVYVRDLSDGSNTGVAVALASYGAGSMAVAIGAPAALERVQDRALMLGGAVLVTIGLGGASLITTGAFSSWYVLLPVWAVLGAGTSAINTPSARLLRRAASENTRASLFTAQFSLSHACFILTYPLAGWVGANAGQVIAAVVLAGLATLGTVAAFWLWPAGNTPADGERTAASGRHS